MPRIRTVKPDFYRDEDLQDLERANPGKQTMLVFSALWGHCDKNGNFEWRPRMLKLDILPFLEFDMADTLACLADGSFVEKYVASDGREYGHISTFGEHQRIGGKEAQEPGKFPKFTNASLGSIREAPEKHPELQEGKGREGKGIEAIVETEPTVSTPECPHELIVAAYHAELPMLRQVREWSPQRQAYLRSRWREKPERQTVQWWIDLFRYIRGKCPFLIGQKKAEFQVDLEWIVRPTNFLKIIEGKYEEGARAA